MEVDRRMHAEEKTVEDEMDGIMEEMEEEKERQTIMKSSSPHHTIND